ncbi:MAG TPA: hypothetical protein VE442_01870 [Jatrophihabitans sp.]|jgi:hypothetical protein|nr:hypothetical protein [Jatrophihabitans sp.]
MLGMRRSVRDDDEVRDTPTAVVWAVAAGTAPLPFLAVYAVLFIVHGGFHHVAPPDITSTQRGELVAGLIALGLFVVGVMALVWMLSGRRRWPFVLVQLGMLATAIDFFVDVTKGGRFVSFVVAVAALAALCCAFAPQSWRHVGQEPPRLGRAKNESPAGVARSG